MCEVCQYASQLLARYGSHLSMPSGLSSDVEAAFVAGFARGFNIRKDTTYIEYCPHHADMVQAALLAEGAHHVPLTSGGTG